MNRSNAGSTWETGASVGKWVKTIFALFLLQTNAALAVGPSSTSVSVQSATPPAAAHAGADAALKISFDQLRRSWNPIDAYRGQIVPPPSMANSVRLQSLVRDGKLYLSLRDAIDLAIENNLDIVIARYNLPIAQMDILRTAAGGFVRGVNTGVVTGTPGGGQGGFGATVGGAGPARARAALQAAPAAPVRALQVSCNPRWGWELRCPVSIRSSTRRASWTTPRRNSPNFQLEGVNVYKVNSIDGTVNYTQNFPTGSSLQVSWFNGRQTTNGIYDFFSPALNSKVEAIVSQQLLAGFGLGPNLRYLRIAQTNRKISEVAFKAQVIATVTQICDMYWDLVNAYDDEQVQEHSVAFAQQALETAQKQLQLQAIPEMDELKSEAELANREQDLTVARTNLELQELLMKNAITRSLDDPLLEEMPVVPTDRIATQIEPVTEPVQEMIDAALQNRTELEELRLGLKNSELSRKTARNALLPSLDVYGLYAGMGLAGVKSGNYALPGVTTVLPVDYGGAVRSAFDNSAPEYQVGLQLSIPLRNRVAKADQYRTELEYRQSQVYFEELKKRILIEVRNARYALEQGASRVDAARHARDLSQKTLDIMQKEQKLGAGSNQQTLSAEHDLSLAESALVSAETEYEKDRIEMQRATGSILSDFGISIAEALALPGNAYHDSCAAAANPAMKTREARHSHSAS